MHSIMGKGKERNVLPHCEKGILCCQCLLLCPVGLCNTALVCQRQNKRSFGY